MHKELWKAIPDYEGQYEVSNNGRIRSIERFVQFNGTLSLVKGKPKKTRTDSYGYQVVSLSKNGKEKTMKVHRLVALAFIPNPENKPFIDHINCIRNDNRVENLRWVTFKENSNNNLTIKHLKNSQTQERIKRQIEALRKRNSKNAPIHIFQYTKEGEFVAEYDTIGDAHKALGRNVGIYYVLDKKNLSAGGYIWRTRKEDSPKYYGRNQNYKLRNILQLDKAGNVIAEYNNLKEASLCTGISIPHIVRSIRSINVGYKYKFKLKE